MKLSGSYVTSGPFKVTQLCHGVTLAAGASCPMTIAVSRPTKGGAAKGYTAGLLERVCRSRFSCEATTPSNS